MKNKFVMIMLILIFSFFVSACGEETSSSKETPTNGKLMIYTTVYPIQFFAQEIGGDAVKVESILPPGSDPHTFEPTTKEMVKMAEADAFIYNGAGLEGYAKKISDAIKSEGVTILESSKGIDLEKHVHEQENAHEEEDHAHEEEAGTQEDGDQHDHEGHDHGSQDPHVWLDPLRSVQIAENIKNMLVEMKPEQKEQFKKNFQQLKEKLDTLDQDFHQQLENKPKDKIIVSHAAYGYWEQAYGIEQIAVSGLSPSNEPSQKDLEEIIHKAEEHGLEHVLFEQNVTPKVSEVVQKEIGAEPLRIHNLSVLTEEDIQNEEDYFSLMNHNLDVLSEALSE